MNTSNVVRNGLSVLVLGALLRCNDAADNVTGTWMGGVGDYGLTLNLQRSRTAISGTLTVLSGWEGTEKFPITSGTYAQSKLTLWTSSTPVNFVNGDTVWHFTVASANQMTDDGSGITLSKQ